MSELARHRDDLKDQLEKLEATLAAQARTMGGEEAEAMRRELEALQEQVRELTAEAERLNDRAGELEVELVPLREETRRAVNYLLSLQGRSRG